MRVNRRHALGLAVSALAAPTLISQAVADASAVQAAADNFAKLNGTTNCLVVAGYPEILWQASHNSEEKLFIASAFKTFVLAQFLRDVESGRLSETTQATIDDSVRALGSSVFGNLTGTTTARSLLEGMIAHSDNTATDITLAAVEPDRVRALIAEAGLTETQIPDSTRREVAYLIGAPIGEDIGWAGMQRYVAGESFGEPRAPINDVQSMASTGEEMVRWYQRALAGEYFTKPTTLVEFKRIHAMADALVSVVPPDTVAYGKGGSLDVGEFHALCLAGQMRVAGVPITFCTTINWTGNDESIKSTFPAFLGAVAEVLQAAASTVG